MTIQKYMLFGLLALGLLALFSLWPAMAADIVIDESGGSVGAGTAGEEGSPGSPGMTAVMVDGALTGQTGGTGDNGEPGGPGPAGEDGGSSTLTTTSPTNGSIMISADGGAGGKGGDGGRGGYGGDGANAGPGASGVPTVGGKGGKGGNGGLGGAGGEGGAGGSIALTVDREVSSDISLSATGGAGGQGGTGGPGGKGGRGGSSASLNADSTVGSGGDGGDGATPGSAGALGWLVTIEGPGTSHPASASVPGQSLPEVYNGPAGQDGAGGTITVALNAAVGGDLTADAGTGDIRVTLNTGASVGGTIVANAAATSALRFAMTVKNKSEYEAAKAYLGDAANALSGSITIDGQTFTWTGFDQLVEALEFIRARAAFSVASGPTYLACSPRAVTAFYKDGGIELIARRTAERGAFQIGRITGQSFSSQNNLGWSVRLDAVGKSFDVLDRTAAVVATCHN